MDWLAAPEYALARTLLTRGLALLYLVAFLSTALQFRPLLGSHGLLPAERVLAATSWRRTPSLLQWRCSDRGALALAWGGAALAALTVAGVPQSGPAWVPLVVWLVLWGAYLSFVNVGQIFYAFGWESILLEAGFVAAFLGADHQAPTWPALLLVRWLVLRVELGAGLIKLRADPCWRDLTCLEYHHETQPLPGPLSWHAHHLPRVWHRIEVAGNHVAQLAAPVGLFLPQPVAGISAALIIATQGYLMVTGNFSWLNAVVIVLALGAVGDGALEWLPAPAVDVGAAPAWLTVVALVAVAGTAYASRHPVRNMASRNQAMNASYNPLHLVGTYGAFGSVTRHRDEIVLEGTDEASPGPDTEWRAYELKAKPGDPARRPPQVAPYHLRLDWLMWFAALSRPERHPWLLPLVERLLTADRDTLRLLRHDPFAGTPPACVRALRYRYRFTTSAERRASGDWWHRELRGEYLPAMRLAPGARRGVEPVGADQDWRPGARRR